MGTRDLAPDEPTRAGAPPVRRRRGTSGSVLALQRMAGNRAVSELMRSPKADAPEGVTAGTALPAGSTVTDADAAHVENGHVGGVDRIVLDGLSGTQGEGWKSAKDRKHMAATGSGKKGHRGRAIALVPRGMKGGGPVSVVVHFHGIDIGKLAGASGMRELGDRPEDVQFFQLPQQLEAFTKKHGGSRVVVLMPLGETVRAGKGFTVDFGLPTMDTFVDECLGQLGLDGGGDGPVYLSAHSGGGFTISALAGDPSRLPKRHRFGGVFGFESFHGDIGTWSQLVKTHLDEDLAKLESLDSERKQLDFLRKEGFRFAAFGGSTKGYAAGAATLRTTILDWFKRRRRRLKKATGGSGPVIDQLWRNYQSSVVKEDHMTALSQDSHFESVLESLVDFPAAASATAAAPKKPDVAPPGPVHHDEHKHDATPPPKAQRHDEPAPIEDTGTDRPFRLEHYPSDPDDVKKAGKLKVLVPKKGHKREIAKAPRDYLVEVLKEAKVADADKWFDQFTSDLTFLGRRFKQPVHKHLAQHLRRVEKELAAKYGGPDKDPVVAGKALGLEENIIGARAYPTVAPVSMHMFGLAVDVNYERNPMVHPNKAENAIFARAGELVDGKKSGLFVGMSYADASRLNKLITEYFKLGQDRAALERKLERAGGFWKGKDADEAQKQIEEDLGGKGGLVERWARGSKNAKVRAASVERIRAQGFLALKEELVSGLRMNWGGGYGDMMHFDMRDDGDKGQRIYAAINRYFARLKKEADADE